MDKKAGYVFFARRSYWCLRDEEIIPVDRVAEVTYRFEGHENYDELPHRDPHRRRPGAFPCSPSRGRPRDAITEERARTLVQALKRVPRSTMASARSIQISASLAHAAAAPSPPFATAVCTAELRPARPTRPDETDETFAD